MTDRPTDYDIGYQDGATGLAQSSTAESYVDGYNAGRVEYLKLFLPPYDN